MIRVVWSGLAGTLLLLGAIITIIRFKQSCCRHASRSIPSQEQWSSQMCGVLYLWERSDREACLQYFRNSSHMVQWGVDLYVFFLIGVLPMHWILFGGVKTQFNSYPPKT